MLDAYFNAFDHGTYFAFRFLLQANSVDITERFIKWGDDRAELWANNVITFIESRPADVMEASPVMMARGGAKHGPKFVESLSDRVSVLVVAPLSTFLDKDDELLEGMIDLMPLLKEKCPG